MEDKHIRVSQERHSRLESLKRDRETDSFDQLIEELIDAAARTALWDDDEERTEYINGLTEPIRREIAGLEMELDRPDSSETIEERITDLEGTPPEELRIRAQRLSRERLWDVRGFLPESETREKYADLSDEEKREILNDMADSCLDVTELRAAERAGQSPAEYVASEYGLQPEIYPTESALEHAMSAVRHGVEEPEEIEPASYPDNNSPGVMRGVRTALEKSQEDN